jgi:hypothetical protein
MKNGASCLIFDVELRADNAKKAFRPSCAARHPAEAQRSQRVIVNTAKEYASEIPSVFMWLGGPPRAL